MAAIKFVAVRILFDKIPRTAFLAIDKPGKHILAFFHRVFSYAASDGSDSLLKVFRYDGGTQSGILYIVKMDGAGIERIV